MTETNLQKYGIGHRDGTAFVVPAAEANALGLPDGLLQNNNLVRVAIPKPRELDLRIPSGNEAGANSQWIPGGRLPGGGREAVISVGRLQPGQYSTRVVGGRGGNVERSSLRQTGATVPVAGEDAWAAAERVYSDIRADTTDVTKIARNTGMKPENIQEVKEHVFFKEHLLDRYRDYGVAPEWARFDASPEMADSCLRLTTGTQTKIDISLLKHETAEAWFMRKNGPSYLDAHTAADRRFPSPY